MVIDVLNVLRIAFRSSEFNAQYHSKLRNDGIGDEVLPSAIAFLDDYLAVLPSPSPSRSDQIVSNSFSGGSTAVNMQSVLIASISAAGAILFCLAGVLFYYRYVNDRLKSEKQKIDAERELKGDVEHSLEYDESHDRGEEFFNLSKLKFKGRKNNKDLPAASASSENLNESNDGDSLLIIISIKRP